MFARFDEIPSMTLLRYTGNCLYKSHSELQREITPVVLALSSKVFINSICLEDRNVFARFDEIPSITLTKMKRLLQCCGSVAATLQQLDMYATTGVNKVANTSC